MKDEDCAQLSEGVATENPATQAPPPATSTPPNGDLSATLPDLGADQPAAVAAPVANSLSKMVCGNSVNGFLSPDDCQLPPKKALSRREMEIERRRQRAARKKERRQLATAQSSTGG